MRRRTMAAVGLWCAGIWQALGHDDFRAAGAGGNDVKFVHESAHEKNAAARSAQKIFFGERIGNVGEFEACAFVRDVDDHLFRSEIDGEVNFLFGLFFIAVMESVDDAFANAHADAIALVFAKAGSFGESEAHFLGQVDTFDLGFERYFKMLGVWRHPARHHAKKRDFCGFVWVTQGERSRQWEERRVISRQLPVVSQRKASERRAWRTRISNDRCLADSLGGEACANTAQGEGPRRVRSEQRGVGIGFSVTAESKGLQVACFVTADYKGVTVAFCESADCKGLTVLLRSIRSFRSLRTRILVGCSTAESKEVKGRKRVFLTSEIDTTADSKGVKRRFFGSAEYKGVKGDFGLSKSVREEGEDGEMRPVKHEKW